MSYTHIDWRYTLPCQKAIPDEVRKALSDWFLELIPCTLKDIHARLSRRWKDVPRAFAPLRDRILEGGKPAIVGRLGSNYLELTLGAKGKDQDLPWIPRTWSTPTKFFPDRAREYLEKARTFPKKELAAMSDEHVEYLAYQHFGNQALVHHYRGEDETWEWAVYVPEPISDKVINDGLKKFGFESDGLLAEFIRAFDGIRESEPGLAGGFIPLREWITTDQERTSKYSWYEHLPPDQQKEWREAIIFFHARNGDHVVLHPSGKAGWMLHEEGRIEDKWPTLERFLADYADALEYRWPFDGYGPSTEAIEARKKRDAKGRGARSK